MLRVFHGRFFGLETSSVCANVIPTTSSCVWSVLCESWCGQQDKREFHKGEKLSSYQLVVFFKHQPKVNIRAESMWLSPSKVGKRLGRVCGLMRVRSIDKINRWMLLRKEDFEPLTESLVVLTCCLKYIKAFFSFRIVFFGTFSVLSKLRNARPHSFFFCLSFLLGWWKNDIVFWR